MEKNIPPIIYNYSPEFLETLHSSFDHRTGLTCLNYLDRTLTELITIIRDVDAITHISNIKIGLKELKNLIQAIKLNSVDDKTLTKNSNDGINEGLKYLTEIMNNLKNSAEALSYYAYTNNCYAIWTELHESLMFFYYKTLFVTYEIRCSKNKKMKKSFKVNEYNEKSQCQIIKSSHNQTIFNPYMNLSDYDLNAEKFNNGGVTSKVLVPYIYKSNNERLNNGEVTSKVLVPYINKSNNDRFNNDGVTSKVIVPYINKDNNYYDDGVDKNETFKFTDYKKTKVSNTMDVNNQQVKYTEEIKLEAVLLAIKLGNNCMAARQIAEKYNGILCESSIRKWIKNLLNHPLVQEEFQKSDDYYICREKNRPIKKKKITIEQEEELISWLDQQKSIREMVTVDDFLVKALEIVNHPDFCASSGFFNKFKKRHGLRVRKGLIK